MMQVKKCLMFIINYFFVLGSLLSAQKKGKRVKIDVGMSVIYSKFCSY